MNQAESSREGSDMTSLREGDWVGIKCDVQSGPFSEERLVTIETVDGLISGFIRNTELRERHGEWEVRGKVKKVFAESIEVYIRGSFFTTNGLASIPRRLAMVA